MTANRRDWTVPLYVNSGVGFCANCQGLGGAIPCHSILGVSSVLMIGTEVPVTTQE